jgi:hypothetical protein
MDRPQVVIETRAGINFAGKRTVGSGDVPTGSTYVRVLSAWSKLFSQLLRKAERPPHNYTSPNTTLADATNHPLIYHEIQFAAAWNWRMLDQLRNACEHNEGMQTLSDDFHGKFRRHNDLGNDLRTLYAPPFIDMLLDKFCNLVVPYEGGPVFGILLDLSAEEFHGTPGLTNWTAAIDLDRGVTSGDVVKLILDDIELAVAELRRESSDADFNSDVRILENMYAALGIPNLKLPESRMRVDPGLWTELQFCELFTFEDTQGAGTDKDIGYPVCSTLDGQIHRAFPKSYTPDWRDFVGFLPSAVKVGETDEGGDNVIYGILTPGGLPGDFFRLHRVYTAEDGWFSTQSAVDMSAADSVQDAIWKYPWVTKHIWGSKCVGVQDPEEDYFIYGPGEFVEFDMRHDDLAKGLFRMIHQQEFGGFDVPIVQ